jgi:hypothetical protein
VGTGSHGDEDAVRRLLLLIPLFSLELFGATAHVQSCTPTTANCTSCTITCNGVAASSTMAVGIAVETSGVTVSTVRDGSSNNYTKSTSSPCLNTNNRTYIYAFKYSSAPGNITITVTPSASGSVTIWADEFSGSDGTLDVDGVGTCTGTGTTFNLPSLTPTVGGDFVYAVCSDLSSTVSAPVGGGTLGGWTGDTITNGDNAEWRVNAGTSVVATQMNSTASSGWSCMEAAYKAAATVVGDALRGPSMFGGSSVIK